MGRKKKIDTLAEYEKTNAWLRKLTDEAIEQRLKKSEFHGLEQNLREAQNALLESYRKSKEIKHPRDAGDQREVILRHFLIQSGLVPTQYAIAEKSTRVVAPSGHISPELDILFYDPTRAIILKRYEVLDYLPIESVHGMVQVKSRLGRKELTEGLDNIAKFKALRPSVPLETDLGGMRMTTGLRPRFGILFAFEYELEWMELIGELEADLKTRPAGQRANMIVVLDKGIFFFGDEQRAVTESLELEGLVNPIVQGSPDQAGHCLSNFYQQLMMLLGRSTAGTPDLSSYFRMPLTAGELSYRFHNEAFQEIGKCSEHGQFLRTISEANLRKILEVAESTAPINWIRAIDLASGNPGDNEEAYARQPADVRIYNPEGLPLSALIVGEKASLTFDGIISRGMTIWLPWYYVAKEGLIGPCPKCAARARAKEKRQSRRKDTASG